MSFLLKGVSQPSGNDVRVPDDRMTEHRASTEQDFGSDHQKQLTGGIRTRGRDLALEGPPNESKASSKLQMGAEHYRAETEPARY